jgi:hypothetical protein
LKNNEFELDSTELYHKEKAICSKAVMGLGNDWSDKLKEERNKEKLLECER